MDAKRAFAWAGTYVALTSLFAVVAFALVAAGGYYGFQEGAAVYESTESYSSALVAGAPGLAVALVGLVVYRLGTAWALFKTLTAATEEEVAETFDTEHVKSDIVAVLDDRLSDMQHDLQSVNRELRDLKAEDDEF
ncbi:hypothetical protein [Salarchaeum sp. JOR-1]|uniref:hypothetical protein n=1 Tax=Salarchaeum sp. JOR-1 TaxID=2599399 RepID=UPI0011986ACD|nr:hypothetical protein [Salarchaeum sp. JOR-1]QDX39740.1 hypothetical protein FQU85_02075 [Salarchaeum sp. JOR-1]